MSNFKPFQRTTQKEVNISNDHIYCPVFSQVFHSLLKAHAVEARGVVRQALDILTPAMPARMEDGNVRRYLQI